MGVSKKSQKWQNVEFTWILTLDNFQWEAIRSSKWKTMGYCSSDLPNYNKTQTPYVYRQELKSFGQPL